MTDYNNGKIFGWNGGECPVHPETVVKYWMNSGQPAHKAICKSLRWRNLGAESDIIAFQVVKAYVEPKVICLKPCPFCGGKAEMNECLVSCVFCSCAVPNGFGYGGERLGYDTEAEAIAAWNTRTGESHD